MSASFNINYQKDVNLSALKQDKLLLAGIGFSDQAIIHTNQKPIFTIATPNLSQNNLTEVWRSHTPVSYSIKNGIQISQNQEVLFGHILLNEDKFLDLRQTSAEIYKRILVFLQQSPYAYLFRIWNYFPDINQQENNLERYRQFCLGRQDALNQHGNFSYSPPAATAIGSKNKGVQVYFIAAKKPGIQLENPRQMSAFLYPAKYAPVSPSFSRATVQSWQNQDQLYISGTASIIGHETQHLGKPLLQLRESLNNIETLIQHGHDTLSLPFKTLQALKLLKLYVRHPADLPQIQALLKQKYADELPDILYLGGDICREDLLLEIEGLYA